MNWQSVLDDLSYKRLTHYEREIYDEAEEYLAGGYSLPDATAEALRSIAERHEIEVE